jgi:hypothetical protein
MGEKGAGSRARSMRGMTFFRRRVVNYKKFERGGMLFYPRNLKGYQSIE